MMLTTSPSNRVHPCLTCGACCAKFRVSFYWREIDSEENLDGVPMELTEFHSPTFSYMKGTGQKNPRCICLDGVLGKKVACTIYEKRPTPCREFTASYENGIQNTRCDDARAQIGLPALRPEDFLNF